MITTPTVLILGAGASINYGFPSGLQLKAQICREIKNTSETRFDLVQFTDNEEHVQDFYDNLLLSSEMSIDAFLEHNPKYLDVGRRAIANILIRKENHEELFDKWIDKWLDPANTDKHWYQLLFSKLNAPFEDFEKNDLTILTFNYDRSLEHFLWESMKAKYSGQNKASILKKLHKIPILHIYGKLGRLPTYDSEGPLPVPYDLFGSVKGKDDNWWRKYIYEASRSIITIHQAKELGTVMTEAQVFLRRAKRIYFLGFGYDQINVERLFFLNGVNLLITENLGAKCFGTALGVSSHHKSFLGQLGLSRMKDDYLHEVRGETHKMFSFPNSTIYDFLYYSPYSKLD